ncbi:MAG TPA: hypothetical protein VIM11_25610 [Tepidisphaeraceae bacterium]
MEIALQFLPVRLPRLAIDSRRCVPLQGQIRLAESFDVVDMVPERSELQILISTGCLSYPVQRAGQVFRKTFAFAGVGFPYAALCPIDLFSWTDWGKFVLDDLPVLLGQAPSRSRAVA